MTAYDEDVTKVVQEERVGSRRSIGKVSGLEQLVDVLSGDVELVEQPLLGEALLASRLFDQQNSHERVQDERTRADWLGTKLPCFLTPSRSTRPMRKRQNLVAFQILLQNLR